MRIECGDLLLERLCKVLGITGAVERIVIDIPADDVARVYVQQALENKQPSIDEILAHLPEEEQPSIVTVERLSVDERGRITAGDVLTR